MTHYSTRSHNMRHNYSYTADLSNHNLMGVAVRTGAWIRSRAFIATHKTILEHLKYLDHIAVLEKQVESHSLYKLM